MGASISQLFTGLIWGKKDIRILILGLVRNSKHAAPGPSDLVFRTMLAKLHCYTD